MGSNTKHDPDALRLTKAQVLHHFDLGIERLKKNKLDNIKVIGALEGFKLMLRLQSEDKLPYYWKVLCTIFDAVRTENELLADKFAKPLVEIQATKVIDTILQVPEEKEKEKSKRWEAAKVVLGHIRAGGMPD